MSSTVQSNLCSNTLKNWNLEKSCDDSSEKKDPFQGLRRGKWKISEEKALVIAIKDYGEDWEKVSKASGIKHSALQCRNKWSKKDQWECPKVARSMRKGPWSQEEDLGLKEEVEKFQDNWRLIGKNLNRTSKDCSTRWCILHQPKTPLSYECCLRLAALGNDSEYLTKKGHRNFNKMAKKFNEEDLIYKYSPSLLKQEFWGERVQSIIKKAMHHPLSSDPRHNSSKSLKRKHLEESPNCRVISSDQHDSFPPD